jgi:membrane fusion protein, macrolide-specific efflux system
MFKKKKTYVILVLIIAIIGGVYYFKTKKAEISYTTQTAKKGTLVKTVAITGEITPPQEINLSFKASGKLETLLVAIGDRVEKGQKIAILNKGVLYEQLAQARLEVEVQKKNLNDMKKRDDTYNSAQRDAQRERIKKAESDVNEILVSIKEAVLYSPIAGMVIRKNFEAGENVTANATVITLATDGDFEIKADIPESDIADVALGQKASVSLDALPTDEKLEAQVIEIEPAATLIQDVVYYKSKLKLSSQDARLKIGMSVDADVNIFEKNDVIMVPLRSVKNENGQDYVEILKGENIIEKVNVKMGLRGDDGMVEIASGLSGGEEIVILSSEK